MNRAEQKRKTGLRLRTSALKCFAEQGYHATQVADIAAAAGVATGTFYVHYESKYALVEEALSDFNEGLALRLQPVVTPLAGSAKKIDKKSRSQLVAQIAESFLDYWEENRSFVRAYSEVALTGVTLEQMRDGINPPMTRFVVTALQLLSPASRDPVSENVLLLMVQGLLAMWLRIGMQYLFSDVYSREDASRALVLATLGVIEESMG